MSGDGLVGCLVCLVMVKTDDEGDDDDDAHDAHDEHVLVVVVAAVVVVFSYRRASSFVFKRPSSQIAQQLTARRAVYHDDYPS